MLYIHTYIPGSTAVRTLASGTPLSPPTPSRSHPIKGRLALPASEHVPRIRCRWEGAESGQYGPYANLRRIYEGSHGWMGGLVGSGPTAEGGIYCATLVGRIFQWDLCRL